MSYDHPNTPLAGIGRAFTSSVPKAEPNFSPGSVFSEVEEIERIDRRLEATLKRAEELLTPLIVPQPPSAGEGKTISPADPMRSELAQRIFNVRVGIDSKIDKLQALLDMVRL